MMKYQECNFDWFEMHAVDHCNLFCKGCSHFSPFFTIRKGSKEHFASEYIPVIDELIRRNVCFNKIAVVGGEPFLHKDFKSFLR